MILVTEAHKLISVGNVSAVDGYKVTKSSALPVVPNYSTQARQLGWVPDTLQPLTVTWGSPWSEKGLFSQNQRASRLLSGS